MENRIDFLNCLNPDTSMKILTCLEDVSDIVRVSCVSRSWRHHVIANGLCKQLCLRIFPQLSRVDHVAESRCSMEEPAEVGSKIVWGSLEREHRVYTFLAHVWASSAPRKLTLVPICASSTDRYPEESIDNTLEPRDKVARGASYWSSKGQSNPAVPEALTYKLVGDLCVITEINIQPFQVYFQWGLPIFSAKAVRFRMGHAKYPIAVPMGESHNDSADDNFLWTYTSQEFPMTQENRLQNFKLPEPVLCIGGILQIELLGRVQRHEMDDLFYICVSHVKILGRSLSPAFGVDILEPSGKFAMKLQSYTQPDESEEPRTRSDLGQIINILGVNVVVEEEYEWGEEEDDSEEEFVL